MTYFEWNTRIDEVHMYDEFIYLLSNDNSLDFYVMPMPMV